MSFLSLDKKGPVLVIVTKEDLEAWNMDPDLLSADQNQPIAERAINSIRNSRINHDLLRLFCSSVDQSQWRVITQRSFYETLHEIYPIARGRYLFICPTSSSIESVRKRFRC